MSEKLDKAGLQHAWTRIKNYIDTYLGTKQNTLVSGTNIKTVDGKNILGSGNLVTDNTWKANTRGQEGYVPAGGSYPNCIWRTDSNGAPSWGTITKAEVLAMLGYKEAPLTLKDTEGNVLTETILIKS